MLCVCGSAFVLCLVVRVVCTWLAVVCENCVPVCPAMSVEYVVS